MNTITFLMLTQSAGTNGQKRRQAASGSQLCSRNKCVTIALLLSLAVAALVFAGLQFFGQNLHDSLHHALVFGTGTAWTVLVGWLTIRTN
jgi:uncharacterized membrane protein (DUF441 family)